MLVYLNLKNSWYCIQNNRKAVHGEHSNNLRCTFHRSCIGEKRVDNSAGVEKLPSYCFSDK